MNGERIEISTSKKKSVKLILSGICLIGLGIFVVAIAEEQQMMSSLVVEMTGYLLLLFVIPSLLYVLYKLSDNTPRIILDSAGITDNTAVTSPGFVPWHEIEEFEVKTIYVTPLLGIVLRDSEYFRESSNPVSRFFNRLNRRLFRSVWLISVNTLEIEFDDFAELARTYHRKFS